ncbi:myosin-5-like [Lolium rigidum]|uniref:myosin-5-like n=1 Tax=Lolium rigidum TaxID=89674 RepID=UPI001F5D549B|nr:myosin-5-like [Lolium rigidum]
MAEHNLSWDQVVQMCRHTHPEEDEELVATAVQDDQLDLEFVTYPGIPRVVRVSRGSLAYVLYLTQFAGSAWEALKHIRQAVDFLVISLKPMRTLREIRTDVCEALSIQQLERIVSMYLDDVNGTNTISAEFASSLKAAAREEANTVTTFSILLDDDSSIPFSLDDITKTMPVIEMAVDDLLPFFRENPSFAFLLQRGE